MTIYEDENILNGAAILVNELKKSFKDKEAVKRISFTVNKGDIFGFLGPNGAGKTTTVKMLNGLISPDSGEIKIFNINPMKYPEKAHGLMGTLTETSQMYNQLTGIENLIFFAKLFGIEKNFARERVANIMKKIGLNDSKDKKLQFYSTGQRKKLSLARVFLHEPQLLILDEPTSGLDPESAKQINEMIKSYAQENQATVFLCTHQLRYAQDICTTYGFINEGNLICTGSFSDIIKRYGQKRHLHLTAKLKETDRSLDDNRCGLNQYKIPILESEEVAAIVKKVVLDGGMVYGAKMEEPNLEEIYFNVIKEEKTYE